MKKKNLTLILILLFVVVVAGALYFNYTRSGKNIKSSEPIDHEIQGIVNKDAILETDNEQGEITVEDLEKLLNQLK